MQGQARREGKHRKKQNKRGGRSKEGGGARAHLSHALPDDGLGGLLVQHLDGELRDAGGALGLLGGARVELQLGPRVLHVVLQLQELLRA